MHGIVQRNFVTRVKGNEESTYRQGDVNLTPADLGAVNEDFSTYSTAGTPFVGSEYVILRSGNTNVKTDIATLASQIGGGSGSEQTALVNYKKIISNVGGNGSFSQTFQDNNITGDMVLLEAHLDDPSIQTSDWTVTCSDSNSGQVTISGSANGTTSVTLYFGVGMSTTPTVLTNLSSNSADNLLKANPRPGVTGTLGVSNGGSGATTPAGARANLGAATAQVISSGSLHDIKVSGLYYLTNGVTDKPVGNGGFYLVSVYNNDYLIGKYVSVSNDEYNIVYTNNTWYYYNTTPYKITITAKPTVSGAVEIPNANRNDIFISALITAGGPGYVVRRDGEYFTVFNNDGGKITTQVTFEAYFMPKGILQG